MNILIVGSEENYHEASQRLSNHALSHAEDLSDIKKEVFDEVEVVFDFISFETPESLSFYEQRPEIAVFLNTVMSTFSEILLFTDAIENPLFGFNGLPTFFDRPILECTLPKNGNRDNLKAFIQKLDWDVEIVEDRVAMATPRIICMIINEAYYTVQEGTASREDIDLGMKLGTNYPFGPFEWKDKIGIDNVFEVLNNIYEDTREERYKICPLLKKEYLQFLN